ncbi:hypothetical protein C8F01DRAFT_1251739 [Mycena amicta]|nr:hypothetical protein C8F01DRAFT_1251739 [Mycena amicta]
MAQGRTGLCQGTRPWRTLFETETSENDLASAIPELPFNLPELIEEARHTTNEQCLNFPSISRADFDEYASPNHQSFKSVNEDCMHFADNIVQLCRLYDHFKRMLDRDSTEKALRAAVDFLFTLVFETSAEANRRHEYSYVFLHVNVSELIYLYRLESKVSVVKYNPADVPNGPAAVATADGVVVIPYPPELLKRPIALLRSGPNLIREYAASYVEYEGGDCNNGRQAIIDSAAIQAVNRASGITSKNYSFSFHRQFVDIIVSWWDEDNDGKHRYWFRRWNDKFMLSSPIDWFKFYAFLCAVRTSHNAIYAYLNDTVSPTTLLALTNSDVFCRKLAAIQEHTSGGGNSANAEGSGASGGGTEVDSDEEIPLGGEAAAEVTVDVFCAEDGDEDMESADENVESEDEDVENETKARLKAWGLGVPLGAPPDPDSARPSS